MTMNPEQMRLTDHDAGKADWKRWGTYLSDRAWGTVREDYSPDGDAWNYFPHDHGVANSRFFKDLMLTPRFGARGQRIDPSKVELLSLAMKLDHRLRRAARHPAAPWPSLRLPRVWAGFRQHDARKLHGEGPEFEEGCRQRRLISNRPISKRGSPRIWFSLVSNGLGQQST